MYRQICGWKHGHDTAFEKLMASADNFNQALQALSDKISEITNGKKEQIDFAHAVIDERIEEIQEHECKLSPDSGCQTCEEIFNLREALK